MHGSSLAARPLHRARLRGVGLAAAAVATLAACGGPAPDLGDLAAAQIDYNWHVRPILSENCFKCHTHGETDEFSYNVVKDGVHIHDLNATLLYLLGIDHERLTFRFQGRDFRLTDVHGKVVHEIVA